MRFRQIPSRLTGFSTPIFGASWKPQESEVAVARRVISFLEDRRVLYAPEEAEDPDHCVASVLEIRHFLTDVIGELSEEDELSASLRAMRVAGRKFLEGGVTGSFLRSDWRLNQALGELRGVFGIHIAQISARYGLDVEDALASILPADPGDDTEDYDVKWRPYR